MFSKPKDKSYKHELKGDQWRAKKNHRKALAEYEKALALDERISLYDKLITALNEIQNDWNEEDFTASVIWAMKKQELEDPTFKRIHARSEPDFQEVFKLIRKMMDAKEHKNETECVENIVGYGETALYPLIDFILTLKELGKEAKKRK